MLHVRSCALAGSFLLGMVASCKDGGGGGGLIDRGACDLLIECASQIAPEARDEYEAVYGQFGTCWQNPQSWAACRDFCRQTLDALNLAGMITGETCGTCSTNADCAQYGLGAYCDAGLCLGGGGGMSDGETGDASGETGGDGDGDGDIPIEAVSILLVVDNSGTMGDKQRTLATSAHLLVDPLEEAGIPWRLGVTTTDNGNPWCPAGSTTPEAGKLVLSSCTTRINDFLFNNGDVNVQDYACNDICVGNNWDILPTTHVFDGTPQQRPWIESDGSQTNLDGITVDEALRCVVPQGINGCGFESQLESARLSVLRAGSNLEDSFGFVHPGRLLVIVFVTDESDCSFNNEWSEIFDQDGNKEFWSDPTASFPTSAVCWNAGMQCIGDPSGYDDCIAANFDVNGNSTNDPDLAVLRPVDGIISDLSEQQEVRVFGIVGVESDGSVEYVDVGSFEPEYQDSFGIGPGCVAPPPMGSTDPVTAVPPGRILTVIETLGPTSGQQAFSVCEADFGPALTEIGNSIAAEFN